MFWTMNKNPNQIMNDIIKLRHSSNGDTYKFHRISPSVVEEVGDYILNVDMFQFVWWNIDHLDNFYFFDFQHLPNDLVI